jgi:hypothetical protein
MISKMTLAELNAVAPSNMQPILTFDEIIKLCASLGLGYILILRK